MRYINDDRMPRKAMRVMAKISKDVFWAMLVGEAGKYDKDIKMGLDYDVDASYKVASALLFDNNSPLTEWKVVNVDNENFTTGDDLFGETLAGDPLLGLQETADGHVYLGFQIGGDWEMPVFGILYFDGNKLRVYYPSAGNCINFDFKCAFGSEELDTGNPTEMSRFDRIYSQYYAANPQAGTWDLNKFLNEHGGKPSEGTLGDMYLMRNGIDSGEGIAFNWELIGEDIKRMFILR